MRLMDFKQGLDRTKNTPIVLKAKFGIKLKVIMSYFPVVFGSEKCSVILQNGEITLYRVTNEIRPYK